MRRVRWILVACAAALVAAVSLGGATPAQACLADNFYIQTYDISMEPQRAEYVLGETALVDVLVVRPASTDPAGLGVPLPSTDTSPASGVYVSVSLKLPKGRAFGWGVTGADGRTTVSVHLNPTRLTAGVADASGYAWTGYPIGCTQVDEYGQVDIDDFVSVLPQPAA